METLRASWVNLSRDNQQQASVQSRVMNNTGTRRNVELLSSLESVFSVLILDELDQDLCA